MRNVTFSEWQPVYAEHGIATIPFSPEKKPLVKHPQKFGLRGSALLTEKFGDAEIFACYAGHFNGLAAIDVDVANENVLIDAIDRHGHTPIVTRSGSGHYHAWYKYNGERRRTRPWKKTEGLDIDLLGAGGAIIVPPSVTKKGDMILSRAVWTIFPTCRQCRGSALKTMWAMSRQPERISIMRNIGPS